MTATPTPPPARPGRSGAVRGGQTKTPLHRGPSDTDVPVPATEAAAPAHLPAWRIRPDGAVSRILIAHPDSHTLDASSDDMEGRKLLRRRLLRRGFLVGLGALSLGAAAVLLDYDNPRDVHGFGGPVTIPAGSVPKPGADPVHFLEGKVWLVNLRPGDGVPEAFQSLAPPSQRGGLLALYHKCPHLGCTVPWRPEFEFGGLAGWFRCPCHGSTYTKGGVRVFGPAQRSMDTFQITSVTAGGVTIDTSKITLGGLNDPQQGPGRAVPAGPFA